MSKLIEDETEKYRRASRLKELRQQRTQLTQEEAGLFFGLSLKKARDAISGWESGKAKPKRVRREKFIEYVRDVLKLSPDELRNLWQELMVEVWGFPPLEHKNDPPSEILPPTPPFVGRQDKVNEIVSYLEKTISDEMATVCVIWGMGGVGKTELARAIAFRLRSLFPGGQLLIELRGEQQAHLSHEEALIPSRALRRIITLLTSDTQLPESEAELVLRYRSALAPKRLLVFADNAHDKAQVASFIPPAGSALIVTAREHLELGGQSFALDTLHPDNAAALLLEICPKIGTYAPEIARLCAYLPLALRICASLLKHPPWKPSTFVVQLRTERLKYLVALNEPAHNPQASVEASLRLSYDALTPALRRVIEQLSIFPASFDVTAAQAVMEKSGEDTHDALTRLYLRSMVQWQEETERYSLHDLVREFCHRSLGDANAVRLRHAQHYASVMSQADTLYLKEAKQKEGLALFDQERVHIDAGWEWARAHAGEVVADELLIAYEGAAFYLGDLRYDNRTERAWRTEAMIDAARRLDRLFDLMQAYKNRGVPFFRIGDYHQAIAAFEAGLGLARELGDAKHTGDFLNNIAYALIKIGELDRSIQYSWERINIIKSLSGVDALRGEAAGMANLADAYLRRGEAQLSLTYAQRGYDLTCQYGDQRGQCNSLGNIASAYYELGERDLALQHFEHAIRLGKELNAVEEVGESSWKLGKMLIDHDLERALSLMQAQVDYLQSQAHPELAQHEAELEELRKRLR